MKKERWSGFDKFVVMADKHKGYIKSDYPAFLDFTVLKSVMENCGKGHDPTNYYHDGETINLGITKGNMLKALDRMFKNVCGAKKLPPLSHVGSCTQLRHVAGALDLDCVFHTIV